MIISHSEVDAFSQCQRKWHYAYGENLRRQTQSVALTRGIQGHKFLETFFKTLQQTGNYKTAMHAYVSHATADSPDMDNSTPAQLKAYWDLVNRIKDVLFKQEELFSSWTIVEIEKKFKLPLFDDVDYGFTVDMIVYYEGAFWLLDWKFIYNFYQPQVVAIAPQMPRYVHALRKLDYNIKDAIYGMIRYRADALDIWKLQKLDLSLIQISNVWEDFQAKAFKLATYRKYLATGGKPEVKGGERSANTMSCEHCPFLNLCVAELKGSDGRVMRRAEYTINDYGYSEKDFN
jgi:hypothetical protein